ncbi:MAG: VWA domain-containing protein [Planctomycetota bacterium]|nr:VWA domain-containing protein [Planctomycetota bacterium]
MANDGVQHQPAEKLLSRQSEEAASARPRHLSAWIGSLILHVFLLVAAGLFLRAIPQGADVEPGRTAGIVLAKTNNDQTQYFSDSSEASQSTSTESSQNASAASTLAESRPNLPEVTGLLPTLPTGTQANTPNTGSLTDATSLLSGGSGVGKVGGQTTQVFGVQGTGSKFVYVFDRSASMEGYGGRPMLEAKRELIASLNSLQKTSRFQIVFYNERPTVFNPNPTTPPELLFGTDSNKEQAQSFVQSIRGRGGTRHLDALRAALKMGPDVIFFLTDADEPQLTSAQLAEIDRWNRSAATIHTIEFGVGAEDAGPNFLREIAKRNLGQYVYRDVSSFASR